MDDLLTVHRLGSACQDAILFDVDWSHWPNVTAYSRPSVNLFR